MLTRFIFLLLLILIWFGLTGYPEQLLQQVFLILIPTLAFLFSMLLGVIAKSCVYRINSIWYLLWLIKEIILASFTVIKIAWGIPLRIRPSLEIIKSCQTKEAGIVTYANSITLTPGTVTLSAEGSNLLVHSLDISGMEDLKTGVMDKKIKRIIR